MFGHEEVVTTDLVSPHTHAHGNSKGYAIPYSYNLLEPTLIELCSLMALSASMNHAVSPTDNKVGLLATLSTGEVVIHGRNSTGQSSG